MARTYVVTGSASGIGAAVAERLRADGARVIGADRRDAEIVADLGRAEGRARLAAEVAARCDGVLDGVVSCAGVVTADDLPVRVNYFGALATLTDLRPLLARGTAPAAVAIASIAVLQPHVEEVTALCRAGDEEAAAAAALRAADAGAGRGAIYASSKHALAVWLRAAAVREEWAGAGIPLNGVAPAVIDTPMMAARLGDPEQRAAIAEQVPMPLGGAGAPAAQPAALAAWLAGPENRLVTGQVLFADGGYDAVVRPGDIWPAPGLRLPA